VKLAESYANASIVKTFVKDGKTYATISDTCDRCGGSGIFYVAIHNGRGIPALPDAGVCYKCNGYGKVTKDVRMYTDIEYERMQRSKKRADEKKRKEWEAKAAERMAEQNLRTLNKYGFENVDAYIVLGNTYDIKDKLKEAGAKFSPELCWVLPTEPTWLTTHSYVKVSVADIFTISNGYFVLRDDIREFRNALEPVRGEYIGKVGQRLSVTATLAKAIPYDASFSYQRTIGYIYIFETADGNTLVWRTTSAWLDIGKEYDIVGTVKEHNEYNKVRQTVLTRCKIKGE
jgi:hypothetical protein